jgi:APA family basic amino acid/polyamine antiporter
MHKVPHRADVVIGALVALLVALTDLRHAIGFSSFCVLTYYAIANAAAWTLPAGNRRWPRSLAVAGGVGCVTLAGTVPAAAASSGALVLAVGTALWVIRRVAGRRGATRPRSYV